MSPLGPFWLLHCCK